MSIVRYEDGKIVYKLPRLPGDKGEFAGLGALILFALALFASSWRKWSDPLIDYGRELYIPWRLATGGKLFKDVDDIYGPLSRYIDAGLFKLFGPGIMVLAFANFIIYWVILGLIYVLFKKAWGSSAALMSCFVFVGVFSFSQLTTTSNYNFITPYSQQVTHGFLICLVLAYIIPGWIKNTTLTRSFWVGVVAGLTGVLKPEFILTSCLILFVAFIIRIKIGGSPSIKVISSLVLGVLLPTLLFITYFLSYLSFKEATMAACFAWLNGLLIWNDTLYAHVLNNFSGMDDSRGHFIVHSLATIKALGLIGLISGLALALNHLTNVWIRHFLGAFILLVVGWVALNRIEWINCGQCLLGLLVVYLLYTFFKIIRIWSVGSLDTADIYRLILGIFAFALISRMILNGRLYQYGFIQAALTAMLIVAAVWAELPVTLKLKHTAHIYYLSWFGILIICGIGNTISHSQKLLEAKTLSVGTGKDLFYSYQGGEIINSFSDILKKQPEEHTLIVIPEGIMVNYLSRKISPVSVAAFYTTRKLETEILLNLKKKPPHWIVNITRDLNEYGVKRYGAKGESGELLIDWVKAKYHPYAVIGVDPLDTDKFGGSIYEINK